MIHSYQILRMNFHRLSLLIEIRRPHLVQFPLKILISSFRNYLSILNFLWALFMQCKNLLIWKWGLVQSNESFLFYVTWDMIRLNWKLRCGTHSSSMLVDGEAKLKAFIQHRRCHLHEERDPGGTNSKLGRKNTGPHRFIKNIRGNTHATTHLKLRHQL